MKYRFIVTALALLSACGESSTPANTTSPAPSAATIPIGVTGKAAGVNFTVTKVETRNQIGPSAVGTKAEAGETFVVVNYTLKNTGASALSVMDRPGITLIDSDGKTYEPDEMAGAMAGASLQDMTGMVSDLNPNVSAKTATAWKLDKAAFDKAKWKLVVATDPALTFALK